jgi:hypothetical protein
MKMESREDSAVAAQENPCAGNSGWVLTRTFLLPVSVILFAVSLRAQSGSQPRMNADSLDRGGINSGRLVIVGAVTAVSVTAIHIYQQNAWWSGARAKFHFEEDLIYAKNVDKVGHLYGANVLTFVFSRSLQWANLPEEKSILWGAIGSTLFQTYVEVEDGFSKYWGFDRVDFASDVVGAWYPFAQHHVPFLKNFNFRFSYLPKTVNEPTGIPGQKHNLLDDYEGQTLWLTLTMKNLLPGSISESWPDFLCLSLGVAVRDNNSPNRYLVWYLAPDLDMTKIIPPNTPFLKTLGEALNFIHFPLPAVRFSPKTVWYGLYF